MVIENVKSVEKLTFRKCARFNDICISHLVENCSECVKSLKIISCGDVSLEGLKNITKFRYVIHFVDINAKDASQLHTANLADNVVCVQVHTLSDKHGMNDLGCYASFD